jgi:hypothetical protein
LGVVNHATGLWASHRKASNEPTLRNRRDYGVTILSLRHQQVLVLVLVLVSVACAGESGVAATPPTTTIPAVTSTGRVPTAAPGATGASTGATAAGTAQGQGEETGFGDVAPFVASGVALFIAVGTAVLTVWRRPKLSVHFDVRNDEDIAIAGSGTPNEVRWLRVRVGNARHRRTAESVEVLAADLRSVRGSWRLPGAVSFRTLRWTHYDDTERLNIAPGAARYLDVIKISRAADGSRARNELHLVPAPSDTDRYVLPVGEYKVALIVTARDTNARRVDLKIKIESDSWPLLDEPASLELL